MTVNELIKELQNLVNEGCGPCKVVNAESDGIYAITAARPYPGADKEVVIYF